MNFTDVFIKRPVLATVVSLLILFMGLRSISLLNTRQFPVSNSAIVTVTTVYTGAGASLIQGFITTPLEKQIASADGIDYIESSSAPGASVITVHLVLNYDPNAAVAQVISKIEKVRSQLPAGALPPAIDVQVGESTAAMYLSFSSEQMDNNQITDYLTRVIQPRLASIGGVQSAQILGARVFAMRIWLKADSLAAYGISPAQVSAALAANNALAALGATKGSFISVNMNATTDLHTAEQFRQLVVKAQRGAVIRLGDIADVVLGAENYDTTVRFNGQSATFIGIYVLPTANSLDVIDRVKAAIPDIATALPAGLRLTVPYDSTAYIHDAIGEVVHTLVEALVIVVLVIYLFLGSMRSVMIPIVAMPLSLVGACFLMLAMGFTINLLTLLAMVLAIGLVVDDAIVVVENIHRHMEEGAPPLQAAVMGARELGGPVVAMTITLAAVYAPIGFQGGLTGTLFREFAFTLVGAVIISGVVALTLSPMMCSRLLRHDADKRGFAHFLDVAFDGLRARYESLLSSAMRTWPVMLMVPVVALGLLWPFYSMTKQELAPDEDQGLIIALSTGASDANVDQTSAYGAEVERDLRAFPETQNIFQVLGAVSSSATSGVANTSIAGMVFKPWSERTRGSIELLPQVGARLSTVSGFKTAAFLRPSLPGGGAGLPVQFVILSTDTPEHQVQIADALVARAMQSGLFVYADTNLKLDQPQGDIDIDRDKAAGLGVSMQEVANDIGSLLGGGYVNYFNIQGNSYKVIPQVERAGRLNPQQLSDCYVSTGNGSLVPLSTFASLRFEVQPQTLNHFQQLNSATLSLAPRPGVSQGQALDYLRQQASLVFPQGYTMDFAGQSRQYVQEGNTLIIAFAFGAIIIFLVLAAQFESFRDPLIILLGSVPMTLAAALAFLFLGFSTINIYTQVGFITLVGLISKHGILIVQFANQMQGQGMDKLAAIKHAAGVRLRPILMTTAAMVLGTLPLVIATGAGAASRYAMGIVIVTGMTVGTFFTIFVVPSVYMLVARDHSASPRDITPASAGGR